MTLKGVSMNKKAKIKEAKYFLARMKEEQDNREHFVHSLSAFLSAARSVLQYALNEVDPKENPSAKPGAKMWYDNLMSVSSTLKFFKRKRDFNIHVEPVHPSAHFQVTLTEKAGISESFSIVHRDKDGKIISKYSSEPPKPKPEKPETSVEHEVRYKFSDWTGDEDVITLCEKYIQELEKAVKDGVSKGFITG